MEAASEHEAEEGMAIWHSCTQVWLDPTPSTPGTPDNEDILNGLVTNTSVLSVVVAGCKIRIINRHIYIAAYLTIGLYSDKRLPYPINSVEMYLPWNDTWGDLPTLPNWTGADGTVHQMTNTHIMSLMTTDGV